MYTGKEVCQGCQKPGNEAPTRCANTLLEYAIKLSDIEKALDTQRETLPKVIQETLDKEKDAIYQKGVLDGQNILLQLESGALSMEDFAKNLKSYEK
jgi:hypothetical protein